MDSDTSHKSQDVRKQLVNLFTMIETERMEGVPVLNNDLSVDAIGFETYGNYHLGILLTPWFMNLMMLPSEGGKENLEGFGFGTKQTHALPGGKFEFIVGHEPEIGRYLSCSLFSPVFEFGDQKTARLTAEFVLESVLTESDAEEDDEDADMREIWAGRLPSEEDPEHLQVQEAIEETHVKKGPPPELSRRDVLRGFRKPEPSIATKPSVDKCGMDGQT